MLPSHTTCMFIFAVFIFLWCLLLFFCNFFFGVLKLDHVTYIASPHKIGLFLDYLFWIYITHTSATMAAPPAKVQKVMTQPIVCTLRLLIHLIIIVKLIYLPYFNLFELSNSYYYRTLFSDTSKMYVLTSASFTPIFFLFFHAAIC